jgi:hypothetical protein
MEEDYGGRITEDGLLVTRYSLLAAREVTF